LKVPLEGAGMNPARVFGPSLVSGYLLFNDTGVKHFVSIMYRCTLLSPCSKRSWFLYITVHIAVTALWLLTS